MAVEEKKRKRTGKAREEAKLAAIAKAEAEASAAAAPAEPETAAPEVLETEAAGNEGDDALNESGEGLEEDAPPAKRRKRTGKMREEAKRIAIQKRLEAEAAALAAGETIGPVIDFDKIAQRIPSGLKKLHPVFKQAKKAESMRLIKKIRFLKTKENAAEAAELEAQLKFLNTIQLNAVAITHLRQKLNKHHQLKHATLPESITSLLPPTPSIASSSSATPELISKVENRLCSSKQVADAIKPTVAWIMSEPGAKLDISASGKKMPVPATVNARQFADSDSDEDEDEGSIGDAEGGESEEEEALRPIAALDSDDEAVIEDRAADEAGWESGSLGGGDGDGDEDGWESGSVSGEDYNIAPASDSDSDGSLPPAKKVKTGEMLKAAAKEATAAVAKAREEKLKAKDEKVQAKVKAEKQEKPEKPTKPVTKADGSSSMFLPSLAAGFTAGDSDSDPDDDYDPDGIIGTKKPERKNRRGQRARQAIWEMKYGKNAKHVQKAREEAEKKMRGPQGQKRDSGWGARSGEGGTAPAPVSAPVRAAPSRAGPPAPAAAAPASKPDEHLHPSWEAARLRKQKEMAIKNAPKATKIVFD